MLTNSSPSPEKQHCVSFDYYGTDWKFINCDDASDFFCKKPQEATPINPDTNGCDKVRRGGMGGGGDEERERRVGVTWGARGGRQKRRKERQGVKRERRLERWEWNEER